MASWQQKTVMKCSGSRSLHDLGFIYKAWILTRQHHTQMNISQETIEVGLERREWTWKRKQYWAPALQNVLKKDISYQNSSFWLSLLYRQIKVLPGEAQGSLRLRFIFFLPFQVGTPSACGRTGPVLLELWRVGTLGIYQHLSTALGALPCTANTKSSPTQKGKGNYTYFRVTSYFLKYIIWFPHRGRYINWLFEIQFILWLKQCYWKRSVHYSG